MSVFNTAGATEATPDTAAPSVMLVVSAAVVVVVDIAAAEVLIDVTRDALAAAMPPTDADGNVRAAAISIE